MVSKAARRYANAFLQIAIEQDQLEAILKDVHTINQTILESSDLTLFLKSPIIKSDIKREALLSIFGKEVQPLTVNFLELVVDKRRENLIQQIMRGFIDAYKKHSGIVDVSVSSAMEISDKLNNELMSTLRKITEKDVNLTFTVNSDLIGGMAVQIEDTVIDGTIRQKINRLRSLFKDAAV